jgi:hypothetical protein
MSYGDHYVLMPKEFGLFELWCNNVNLDIQRAWERHNDANKSEGLYICTKHFAPCDVADNGTLKAGASTSTSDFTIKGSRRQWGGVMIPAAAVQTITGDPRCSSNSRSRGRSVNTQPSSCSSSASSSSSSLKRGFREIGDENIDRLVNDDTKETPAAIKQSTYESRSKPACYCILADPFNLVSAMYQMNEHARACGTETLIHKSRDHVQFHGLAGSITFHCSEGDKCRHWKQGIFTCYTQTPVPTDKLAQSHGIDKNIRKKWKGFMPKLEFRSNLLHATAETITSVMPAESQRILVLLGFKTRSDTVLRTYRENFIIDQVLLMQAEEEKRVFEKYAHADGNVFSYDAAHNCVRDAQHTTGTSILAGSNVIAKLTVSSTGHAASREDKILREQIADMHTLGFNLVAGITDQSASGISIIRKCLPSGEAIADLWHTMKNLRKLLEDLIRKFEDTVLALLKFSHHHYRSELGRSPDTSELTGVTERLMLSFETHHQFDALPDQFKAKGYGIDKWEQCANNKDELEAVGREFGLLSSNTTANSDPRVAHIPATQKSGFRLYQQSMKVTKDVLIALINNPAISDSLIQKVEDGVKLLPQKLRNSAKIRGLIDCIAKNCENVPTSWRVGDLGTVSLETAVSATKDHVVQVVAELKKEAKTSPSTNGRSKAMTEKETKLVESINKSWSKAEAKKSTKITCMDEINTDILNKVQLTALAGHVDVDITNQKAANLKILCAAKLDSSLRVASQSISKACALMRERLSGGPSSFRSYFAQACRHVNDYFGPFSRDFKTWWIKEAMRNWAKHWCDNHSTCAGYSWYSTCHLRGPTGIPQAEGTFSSPSQAKLKISDYDNKFPFITAFFDNIVTVVLADRRFESRIYDVSLYGHTYSNESFFHALQIMISQTIGITHDFYKCRAIVAMLEFNWQREWKVLNQGVLRKNKHSTTVVRKQHLPHMTGPRLEIARRVLGPLFEPGGEADPKGIFDAWRNTKVNFLQRKREKRIKYLGKATEKGKKEIEIYRTICPVKAELGSERSGASFIEYQTRAPLPFMHTDERKLGKEEAETLLMIGHQAREFNMKNERRRQEARQPAAAGNDEDEDEDEDENGVVDGDGVYSDEDDEEDVGGETSAEYLRGLRK